MSDPKKQLQQVTETLKKILEKPTQGGGSSSQGTSSGGH